jgi:hypothetical protein
MMLSTSLAGRAACGKQAIRLAVSIRYTSSSTHRRYGQHSTLPSTSKPQNSDAIKAKLIKEANDGDRGYLAFTKSSLFK